MDNILKKFGFPTVQGALKAERKAQRRDKNRKRNSPSKNRTAWGLGLRGLGSAALLMGGAAAANAQDMPPMMMPPPPPAMPAMAGPLAVNPNPLTLDLGPLGEKVYVTGAVTGLAYVQDQATKAPGVNDNTGGFDLANGQVFVQKIDGVFQYFIQAGAYSVPNLGFPWAKSSVAMNLLWGTVPQAFVKLALNDQFSIQAGKLPTLIGDEYTFTFENMDIQRGLLWDEEPAVSRGVQVNFSQGPISVSASLNDGYYSDRYNWASGLVSWTIDMENTLAFAAGGNFGHTGFAGSATPFLQNNSSIFNVIFTHSAGPLVISPYFQYQHVSKDLAHGIPTDGSAYGGAVLASFSFNDNWKIAGRVEYITTSGDGVNFLYGPKSSAFSITVTPTFQYHQFFARAEMGYVSASGIVHATSDGEGGFFPGTGIGPIGNATSQVRGMFETGILF
jgi:putative OmpL-like beta-barrel porin-2